MEYVIGIDVGGTFTDIVCSDGAHTWRAKSPTNPARFADGVLGGLELIAEQVGCEAGALLSRVVRFGLGTTAVTNVLATKRGRQVGVLVTAGFEDELHTARNKRVGVDGWLMKPWNPVARSAVRGLHERIDRGGAVLVPLDPAEVRIVAAELIERQKVDAFAISLLWSFKNDAHERLAAETIRAAHPYIPVFCGAALHPVMREYERTTLAMLNAFTAGALDGVEELESLLKSMGLRAPVLLLHSGGGAISVAESRNTPIALASSGPAAGATAAAEVASVAGLRNVICCDMGGTSVDVAVVRDGTPERRQRAEVEGITTAQSAVDVESIGAGGGSIAWIDPRGLLRVGPQSARANPGPVCYGRGGTEPTVTDAMILLGYIDPASFMGGRMSLDVEAARAACERLGARLGLSAIETAFGIREIAMAEMSKAIRARVASGGIDVRKFGMVAFGGSGSLFAPPIARDLGIGSVMTSSIASVLSAYGAATADIRRERVASINQLLPLPDESARERLEHLAKTVRDDLEAQGIPPPQRELVFEADLRFYRQKWEMTARIEPEQLAGDRLAQTFRTLYMDRYGKSSLTKNTPIELGTIRVVGIGRSIRANLPADGEAAANSKAPKLAERPVWVARDAQHVVPVFDMEQIRPGHVIAGPALIDAVDSTLWAPPGATVTLARGRTLVTSFATPG